MAINNRQILKGFGLSVDAEMYLEPKRARASHVPRMGLAGRLVFDTFVSIRINRYLVSIRSINIKYLLILLMLGI